MPASRFFPLHAPRVHAPSGPTHPRGAGLLPNPSRPKRAGNALSLTQTQRRHAIHVATHHRRPRVSPAHPRLDGAGLPHLTNAHSKKVENHQHAHAIYFMYYNFCRIHQTLRVTPAMAAGVTDHAWSFAEIVGLMDVRKAEIYMRA
jgi:hypothetical protein